MKKIIASLLFTIVAVAFLGFIACDIGGESTTGDLHLNISKNISRSTLVPDIDMDVATYVVSGVGPGHTSFGPTETNLNSLTIPDLAIGLWKIEVLGKNTEGEIIGEGENSVTILPNSAAQVVVAVYQTDGNGSLEIFASWPESALINPEVIGRLVSEDTLTTYDLLFVPGDSGTSHCLLEEIPKGYYDLTLSLFEGETFMLGRYNAVWIVAGSTTEGDFTIVTEDLEFISDLDLTIENTIKQPYEITLTKSPEVIDLGGEIWIQATVVPENPKYQYQWYLNGQLLLDQEGSEIIIGADLGIGKYQVDVRVWNEAEHVLSSGSTTFKVSETTNDGTIVGVAQFFNAEDHTGILVKAIGNNILLETTTGEDGTFLFENLPTLELIIEASYTDYYGTSVYISAVDGEETQVSDLMILYPIDQYGSVEGHAYYIDKTNHSGIAVNIRTLEGQELPDLIALTDSDGFFQFAKVPVDNQTGSATYVFTAFAIDGSLGYATDSITGSVTSGSTLTTDDLWLRSRAASVIIFADDTAPWDSDALSEMLKILDVNYSIHTSAEMATLLLPVNKTVWIINDQPQSFYDAYAASQTRFNDFVQLGGTLLFEACDQGWNGGSIVGAGATLPGGVINSLEFYYNNTNVNPTHPMMEYVPIELNGSYASHNFFENLPANATILTEDEAGGATLVEYKFGQGRVIATGQPLEFHWANSQNPRQIYPNMIFYTFYLPIYDIFATPMEEEPRAMVPRAIMKIQPSSH